VFGLNSGIRFENTGPKTFFIPSNNTVNSLSLTIDTNLIYIDKNFIGNDSNSKILKSYFRINKRMLTTPSVGDTNIFYCERNSAGGGGGDFV
jgi:hypothetical protein